MFEVYERLLELSVEVLLAHFQLNALAVKFTRMAFSLFLDVLEEVHTSGVHVLMI